MASSTRLPTPSFTTGQSYELYKKEVTIWENITSVEAKNRALHLLLALPGKDKDREGIKDKLLETIKTEDLKKETGVKYLTECMDKFLAKDVLETKWEYFQDFENYEKGEGESILQYIANFDTYYSKLKLNLEETLTLPSSILAFKLLKGAKLTEEQRLVVMTSMDFDKLESLYTQAKKSLKKFFGSHDAGYNTSNAGLNIKSEPVFYTSSNGRGKNVSFAGAGSMINRGNSYTQGSSQGKHATQKDINPRGKDGKVLRCYGCDSYRHMGSVCKDTAVNVKGKDGKVLRCLVCESFKHLLAGCPHSWESMRQRSVNFAEAPEIDEEELCGLEITDITEPVVLFTRNEEELNVLMTESLYSGVLDSGCQSTVCGERWLETYIDKLSDNQRASVVRHPPSNKVFAFGGEYKLPSIGVVTIPGSITGQPVLIKADVVKSKIPLLFSRNSMKAMKAKVDYEHDTGYIFDKPVVLSSTSVGHHSVQILPDQGDDKLTDVVEVNTNDTTNDTNMTLENVIKLHRQYGHPNKVTFIKHLKASSVWSDDIKCFVDECYDSCNVCKLYARTPSRPAVCLPLAYEFNELVSMDLKYWKPGLWILHMIDVFSRFSQSVFVTSKQPKAIIESVITNWVGVFGIMGRGIITDNGGEFSNQDMREMSSLINCELLTTAAEAAFQNGLCERNHGVIDMILYKLIHDYPKSPLNVLLKWANMAKNSLQMWSGYSSYQIVFGSNPKLPNVMTDHLPALEDGSEHELFSRHISAIHTARQEFIKSESCGRIKRALRSRIRASEKVFSNNEQVYYKREKDNKWLGPGKVIGQDGKIVYVIHGGHLIRVANSRVIGVSTSENYTPDTSKDLLLDTGNNLSLEPDDIKGNFEPFETVGDEQDQREQVTPDQATASGQDQQVIHEKVSRALSRLQPFNKPGLLENEANVEVMSVAVPAAEHNSPDCIEAKKQELDKIEDFGVYTEVQDEGQRCISTRWVLIKKGTQIKARLVARGFEEHLSCAVDSPTVGKPCVRMVLAIAASKKWVIKSTDIKSAFLQGHQIERDVFLKPPKEAKTPVGKIWKLRRCLYGLNDAARQFYTSLSQELMRLGCTKNQLDPTLFAVFDPNGSLTGVLVSHVDDILHAGNESFQNIIEKLIQRFSAGSNESITFTYTGYHLTQSEDFSILLDQREYLEAIDICYLKSRNKLDRLTPQEQTVYRKYVGKLGWLVQGTRPDVAFKWLDASTKNRAATVEDLASVMKVLLNAKVSDSCILFPGLGDHKNWKLVVYSDAALANLNEGTGSTGGCVVFLTGENGRCCPILWKAGKLRRVCRSSAAAEGMSLSNALEEAVYLRTMLCQILGIDRGLPVIAYTDHEGLRCNISNVLHPKVDDKRLKIEIANIRQMLSTGDVHDIIWCKSQLQLADCLTKKGASGVKLLKVLQSGKFE